MPKNLFNFTKDNLLKIKPPKMNRDIYKDAKEKGLILIVSYGGSKVFYLAANIQGAYHRIKIDKFPDISIAEARAKAIDIKNQIATGIDPTKKEDMSIDIEITFKELFDRYINDYAKHNIKSWKSDIADMDRKAKNLYDKKITSITRDDMQKIFNDLTIIGKYSANRFLSRLGTVFNKAIEWELLEKNPTLGIKKHK